MFRNNSLRSITMALLTAAVCIVLLCASEVQPVFAEGETPEEGQPAVEEPAPVMPPRKCKIKSITSPDEHVIKIEWRKRTCDGYVIRFANNKKLKNATRIVVKSGKTAKTIKNLKCGKTYWFKIRAFNNKTLKSGKVKAVYGEWSKKKPQTVHTHKYRRSSYLNAPEGIRYIACYSCSCGRAYYRSCTVKGRKYDGIVTRAPSCISGLVRKTPSSGEKKIPAVNTHKPVKSGKNMVCKTCGQKLNYINTEYVDEETGAKKNVVFVAPKNTCVDSSVAVSVKNQAGKKMKFKLYWQKAKVTNFKYPEYQQYLYYHGCSTCALTTILNATVPKYKNLTPDRTLVEVIKPVVGDAVYNANFSKTLMKQMPIGLKGITKVLRANGVRCKYVYNYTKSSAAKEIKAHLQSGNLVIFTIRQSIYSKYPHTMTMLGLDKNGRIIVGDSSLCSAAKWGANNRLVKFNIVKDPKSSKIKNICKYFKYSTTSVDNVQDFYHGKPGNIGYVLVYKD